MSQYQANQFQKQQDAKEREERQQAEYERLKGFDFLRALYEMACPGVKK
jgi:RecA-family ATPase